ncbi:unnamed protein product [Moneuplotes crassus]|uniref:Uncharacterized protein n=1 Tax=Euplotes crassus TaxID=5936 RepID=A0AAD1Y4R5_EUPCR|nr:unnamed protein product [Moneuplotes crassus]
MYEYRLKQICKDSQKEFNSLFQRSRSKKLFTNFSDYSEGDIYNNKNMQIEGLINTSKVEKKIELLEGKANRISQLDGPNSSYFQAFSGVQVDKSMSHINEGIELSTGRQEEESKENKDIQDIVARQTSPEIQLERKEERLTKRQEKKKWNKIVAFMRKNPEILIDLLAIKKPKKIEHHEYQRFDQDYPYMESNADHVSIPTQYFYSNSRSLKSGYKSENLKKSSHPNVHEKPAAQILRSRMKQRTAVKSNRRPLQQFSKRSSQKVNDEMYFAKNKDSHNQVDPRSKTNWKGIERRKKTIEHKNDSFHMDFRSKSMKRGQKRISQMPLHNSSHEGGLKEGKFPRINNEKIKNSALKSSKKVNPKHTLRNKTAYNQKRKGEPTKKSSDNTGSQINTNKSDAKSLKKSEPNESKIITGSVRITGSQPTNIKEDHIATIPEVKEGVEKGKEEDAKDDASKPDQCNLDTIHTRNAYNDDPNYSASVKVVTAKENPSIFELQNKSADSKMTETAKLGAENAQTFAKQELTPRKIEEENISGNTSNIDASDSRYIKSSVNGRLESFRDSKISVSSNLPDWKYSGLYKLFIIQYEKDSKGYPKIEYGNLSLTTLEHTLSEFVYLNYLRENGKAPEKAEEIFNDAKAHSTLKYIRLGMKSETDRPVEADDSSSEGGYRNENEEDFTSNCLKHFQVGMSTLKYVMGLLNLHKNYTKIVHAYRTDSVEDSMKCLLRCKKIYDGIDLLGEIFLLVKHAQEIRKFCKKQENIEKIQLNSINIEDMVEQLNSSLGKKISLFCGDYGRLCRNSRSVEEKILICDQEYCSI